MTRDQVYQSALIYFRGDTLAANVWVDKYCLKDRNNIYYESTPDDMHRRLAKELARIEANYPNPMSEEEIYELLRDFRYIVPQGSPMAGIGNDFVNVSLSNCFVIGSNDNSDSYGGIMRTDEEQVQLMKRRGGVGHDLSHLRPNGALANNSKLTGLSGAVGYAERYSNSTKEVSQGNRRGALMLTMDIRHPDVERFIDSKLEDGKITGANISIKITDEFMEKVIKGQKFVQTFPIDLNLADHTPFLESLYNNLIKEDELINLEWDNEYKGCYAKVVDAKRIWNKIILNAWKSAEPGVLFWDRVIQESPADYYWETISTNPCFTGDTIIAVADGRNGVPIKDLCDGRVFDVYSARPNRSNGNNSGGWKTEIKEAIAFKTGIKKVILVTLSDGSSFKCTPDHLLAIDSCEYIKASESLHSSLSKFYSFSNQDTKKSYRVINSVDNSYNRQYRMIYERNFGEYDGKKFNIDHIDGDCTNDDLSNLRLLTIEEHKSVTDRGGLNNPIMKMDPRRRSLMNKRKGILANSKRYDWSEERTNIQLGKFDKEFGDYLNSFNNSSNVCLNDTVTVVSIQELGEEEVYDLKVRDNHNFYIITKSLDDKYLNSSGVLVHNCGELPLPEYDSCRLLLLNLYSYVDGAFTPNAEFNVRLFKNHVIKAQRLMDDIVDLEIEKINKIINKISSDPEPDDIKSVELKLWNKILDSAKLGRRTGLGVTGEGDMLAALNLRYGSEEAIEHSEFVHSVLAKYSYYSSIIMAEERGAFPLYHSDETSLFLTRIKSVLNRGIIEKYNKFGRRNIANLTIAPAGSVSILTQTTSGIEPAFAIYYKRRRRTEDKSKASFIDEQGEMFEDFMVFHHKFEDWYDMNWHKTDVKLFDLDFKKPLDMYTEEEIDELIKKSPYYMATANDMDWVSKVSLQGRVQKWVDHSISATTNVPKHITPQTVSDIYMEAWSGGCKGMTIYRDGSRSGILVSKDDNDSSFVYMDAVKRPKELICDIYHKTALKKNWMILVGLYNDRPYEIFAFPEVENSIFPSKLDKGKIIKVKSKNYKLIGKDGDKTYEIPNFIEFIGDEGQVLTRKFSMMLRHRIDPKWIVKEIEEFSVITSFDKVIQRVLKNYVSDLNLGKCDVCGSELRNEGGCSVCPDCGFSKCN